MYAYYPFYGSDFRKNADVLDSTLIAWIAMTKKYEERSILEAVDQ